MHYPLQTEYLILKFIRIMMGLKNFHMSETNPKLGLFSYLNTKLLSIFLGVWCSPKILANV
jgi:hypothetical protein